MNLEPIAATLLLLAVAYPALAKNKLKDSDYQSATLLSFHTESRGSSCSGKTNGQVDDSGNVTARTSTECSDSQVRIYTIRVGERTLSIEPAATGKQIAKGMATLGWSEVFSKGSVLRDQLPGAQIKVRSDSSGLYVRVGKKESKFKIVEAQ